MGFMDLIDADRPTAIFSGPVDQPGNISFGLSPENLRRTRLNDKRYKKGRDAGIHHFLYSFLPQN